MLLQRNGGPDELEESFHRPSRNVYGLGRSLPEGCSRRSQAGGVPAQHSEASFGLVVMRKTAEAQELPRALTRPRCVPARCTADSRSQVALANFQSARGSIFLDARLHKTCAQVFKNKSMQHGCNASPERIFQSSRNFLLRSRHHELHS